MAKIHTHYDNLKVSRHAPQEVIRAAYKALSQKYHPDKNHGDERAARVMAIVNTAYNILSDPARRKEHDEWIAAEEWEVAWLESSRSDDGRDRPRPDGTWEPRQVEAPSRLRFLRDARWWGAMVACFAGGAVVAALLVDPPKILPDLAAGSAGRRRQRRWLGPASGPGRCAARDQGAGRDPARGAGACARLRYRPAKPGLAER
jgi:curved DNA-binding protein CbpA